jgi:carbonic anhydrase
MVASESKNPNLTPSGGHLPCGVRERARGKVGLTLAGLIAMTLLVSGYEVRAAEPKAEAKSGKGDAVIESELRKALIGKSALTGELLMKTGEEARPAPEKNPTANPARSKEAKEPKDTKEAREPKSKEVAFGKKMPMPSADGHAAKIAQGDASGGVEVHGPSAVSATAVAGAVEKSAKGKAHWGYTGAIGPEAWSRLSAEFATCGKGRRQSPIDLVDRDFSPLSLEQVRFDYLPAAFQVVHNGHTVEVRPAGTNRIVARGKDYKLLQFHFHHPAEERFNGKGFALDAHFVHRADDGELAVVTVLFEEGAANPELQRIWDHMPLDSNDRVGSGEGVTFNPVSMLPADRAKHLQYIGSLTTPPCTEGVVWFVLRQPVTASAEQIALFRKMVGMNARPVQPVNGRLIKVAN